MLNLRVTYKKMMNGLSRSGILRLNKFSFGLILLLFTTSCRYDMQDMPRYEPYEQSDFFKDGLASRPFPEGTVARGFLKEDTLLYTGKPNANKPSSASTSQKPTGQNNQQATTSENNQSSDQSTQVGSDLFPFPVTAEVMDRGESRFNIYCSVCHGKTGDGDGMIVQRGYRKPPSFHDTRLKESDTAHFFDVITNGFGAMPSYSGQLSAHDRWAIIAYIRALQLSRENVPTQQPVSQQPTNTQPQSGGHH